MNGFQIEQCLKSDLFTKQTFQGVFSSDQLPKKRVDHLPCALIANTDPIGKPGTHWVAFYIDENNCGEYFDSYGKQPKLSSFKTFLTRNTSNDWVSNFIPLQGTFSAVCGQYCIFYLLHRSRNMTLQNIVGLFTENDKDFNDFSVNEFITERFQLDNIQTWDDKFIHSQISRQLYAE